MAFTTALADPPGAQAAAGRLRDRVQARFSAEVMTEAVLAAYGEILSLWSKSPRFTVNVTTFNRMPIHPGINRVVGDQRVRLRYCDGYWGKAQQCPAAPQADHGQ